MSRRRHRQVKTKAALAAACGGVLWWAWQAHPAGLIVCGTLAAAATLGAWRARCAWLMRDGQKTDLYFHYFGDGTPLYFGISNDYAARCTQHADESWWFYYVDPSRSVKQTWPNREAALRAEAAAIRQWSPIGNYQHNPDYVAQHPRRLQLQAEAAAHRGYAQPAPVITGNWAPAPRARVRRQRALGGAR